MALTRPLVLLLTLPIVRSASLEECTTNCQPTTDAMTQCNQRCFDQGYCCDGTTFASSHALLSCNHGCRIAWFAKDVAECKAHCSAGNAGGCSYDGSLETGTLHKCNNCQEGCAGSTSRDECAAGCDNAFAVNDLGLGPAMTFYNDLKYTSPPSPPPHQKNACTVATGMSASFVENIEGTGYWSASAVFDDEQFAFVQAGDNWLWNDRGLLCVDGESSPRDRIELFDDGLGGDDVAGDTRYTRSCLSICPGVLAAHGVTEECINCGSAQTGAKLLGILSASLRGKISSRRLDDLSPTSHQGCESVTLTSHGIFAVCPAMMPTYPVVNAWDIQTPPSCVPCRKAMDHLGEAFDFFSLRGRVRLKGAGDNYIRVRDTVDGIGFSPERLADADDNGAGDSWGFGPRACTLTTRVQGIAWGQYETGYTHELAHWIGVDFNNNGMLPEYHHSDGAHLPGGCTVHGPLQGPVWCWDTGYPCAVRPYDTDTEHNVDVILEPNDDCADDTASTCTFQYVRYDDAHGNQRHSQILLYAAGLIPASEVTETYYCLGGTVDDSDPKRITATVIDSFGIDRFVAAHGPRDPAYPKPLAWSTDGDIRVGQITVSEKEFTDAEIAWWTLWNRHFEDDAAYDPKATDHWGWGGAGWDGGFPTWTFATDGKSKSRTKLRGEACEDEGSGTFRPASCDAPDDAPAQVCTLNRDTPLSPLPPSPPPGALSYYRESGQAISSNSVSISYGGAAASSKLYASDIAPGASLLHECAATCDTEPSCVAFVHDFGSNPHCVFKKSTTTYANAAKNVYLRPPSPFPPPSPPPPSPPTSPMAFFWKVYYDKWITGGEEYENGGADGGADCRAKCEADASCVGLQLGSSGNHQCYKITDAHVINIEFGGRPMTPQEAATMDDEWSVWLKDRVPVAVPSEPEPPDEPAPPEVPTTPVAEPDPVAEEPEEPSPSPPPPSPPPCFRGEMGPGVVCPDDDDDPSDANDENDAGRCRDCRAATSAAVAAAAILTASQRRLLFGTLPGTSAQPHSRARTPAPTRRHHLITADPCEEACAGFLCAGLLCAKYL